MDEVLTELTMQKLMTMPKGVMREFASPLKDQTGRVKIAMTDAFFISDSTMVADTDTAPWVLYNDRSFVEMNFILEDKFYKPTKGCWTGITIEKAITRSCSTRTHWKRINWLVQERIVYFQYMFYRRK